MLDVKKAKDELSKKSYREIQEVTAWTWASRAAASYENVLTAESEAVIATLLLAEEYYHEALEHAALVDVGGSDLLNKIQDAVSVYSTAALTYVERAMT